MSTELQAQMLAEWLDRHPGQEPPADLDPEVVEALYVLRPELAPPPRVSVDDILAGLTAGPFADGGAYATEDEVAGEDEAAPTQPVWAEEGYATEDEVDADRAPTMPVWTDEDYATEEEVAGEDEDEITEMVSGNKDDAPTEAVDAASPMEAVDAATPMEAVDAATPMEAVDAASPMEAVDAASPMEASQRSREEREADPAAKARARLAVLPTPEERREREQAEQERERRRRMRLIFGGGTGGVIALAAVALIAMRATVLAPDNEPSLASPDEVSEAPRVFEELADEEEAKPDAAAKPADRQGATAEGRERDARFAIEGEPEADPAPAEQPLAKVGADAPAEQQATKELSANLQSAPPPAAPPPAMKPAPSPGYGEVGLAFDADDYAEPVGGALPATGSTTRGAALADETVADGDADPAPTDDSALARSTTSGEAAAGIVEVAEAEEALDALGYVAEDVGGDAPSADYADEPTAARREAVTISEAKSRSRDGLFSGRKKEEAAQAPSAEAAPAVTAAAPTDLASLRARALPSDLPSTPASPDPAALAEYRIANTAADTYVGAGESGQAASELAAKVGPPAEVGMAYAARAAELYLGQGAYTRAADVSRKGLALSTANSAWRALLFVRLGDALAGLGDTAGARDAYQSAIALNAGR